jgi:pimeloyl-ACP methyl ester carboxylesterase
MRPSVATRLAVALIALLSFPLVARADDQFFDSDGVRIRYVVRGHGEPVVLIHGLAANLDINWMTVMKPLSADYQVIALDLRGHGKSDKPHGPDRYGAAMAEDVIRLLDHLHVQRAHLVGYSLGAMVSAKVVATHPDRVLTVTLGGAAGVLDAPETWLVSKATADALENGRGLLPLLEALKPPGAPKVTPAQVKVMNAFLNATNDPLALAAVLRGVRGLVVSDEQVRQIKVPVQAIVGSLDPLKRSVDAWKELLPDMRVDVIEGADHLRGPMRPEFLRVLKSFLAAHAAHKADAPQRRAG